MTLKIERHYEKKVVKLLVTDEDGLVTTYDTIAECMNCEHTKLISGETACCLLCDSSAEAIKEAEYTDIEVD